MGRTVEYPVILTEEEKDHLRKHTSSGNWGVRAVKRAQILLKADISENAALEDEQIAQEVKCCVSTVHNIKLRFAKGERLNVTNDNPRTGRPKIVDGELEAHIIAIACSSPPEGRVRWTVRLLADKIVTLTEIDSCSPASVSRALKKMNLSLGSKKNGKFPEEIATNLSGEWKQF
jgi:Homeodomain-like domain